MPNIYKKVKKQNGEVFAQTLRNYHNGLLEIPNIENIVHHAGRDAIVLLPYLMSLLASNGDNSQPSLVQDPFVLLDQAGYDAFHADTLQKQNSIAKYFKSGELLRTFNDHSRYQRYHIVHAVKKDVDNIERKDFIGIEKREDAYATSVISIQMLKKGGFISIKNRYNSSTLGCDNVFKNNPDNIVKGLSSALEKYFNVEFSAAKKNLPDVPDINLPEGFSIHNGLVFQYHKEVNDIYYGDQAWAEDGVIHTVNRSVGDALFDIFLFDNKSKTLRQVDTMVTDGFVSDFNRCYGGNPGLTIKNGNLYLKDELIIGADKSRIKTLYLPGLTEMNDSCLRNCDSLIDFNAPDLRLMASACLNEARALAHFNAPVLSLMSRGCLQHTRALTHFNGPALISMGACCLREAKSLNDFNAPSLTKMNTFCLQDAPKLKYFNAPALTSVGTCCLAKSFMLATFNAPLLKPLLPHIKVGLARPKPKHRG